MSAIRNLLLVFGDQLNRDSSVFDDFDPERDRVWMAENDEEATHVWCHKFRLVAFFAPMRHFRDQLESEGITVWYHELSPDPKESADSSFVSVLGKTLGEHSVDRIIMVQPGDHRVQSAMVDFAKEHHMPLEIREDSHFYCSAERFREWAQGRKSLVMESFYREMRREHNVLMDSGKPVGGAWNYDKENRSKFGKEGPIDLPSGPAFSPDPVTREVMSMVERRFADHPGRLDTFDLPVTREQALVCLDDFVNHRLAVFGRYQDAMWKGETFLYHSRISHALNLHLLNPREVVESVLEAFREGLAPLNSVEGFIRQILGWREYVRGIYWWKMPEYAELNALSCDPDQDVPSFLWDGDTEMACVADAMRLVIDSAYAHHIQRLMVLGLISQLWGVHPGRFNQWHMAMYADAVDWVSLPNTLGMSQHGDGGIMATKPYCASGNYINRMSNLCKGCRYSPGEAIGESACPFTTLYWNFLDRHREEFEGNHRMTMQLRNLDRKKDGDMAEIRARAEAIRSGKLPV